MDGSAVAVVAAVRNTAAAFDSISLRDWIDPTPEQLSTFPAFSLSTESEALNIKLFALEIIVLDTTVEEKECEHRNSDTAINERSARDEHACRMLQYIRAIVCQ